MTKLSIVAAVCMVAGVSALASAEAPEAPGVYGLGPFSPRAATTNLSVQERAAYALLEGVMQSVEGNIHTSGCTPVVLPLEVYSDAFSIPVAGDATLGTAPGSLVLNAVALTIPNYRGQIIKVDQPAGASYVNGTEITGYSGTMTYNSANNMMVGKMTVNVMSGNWIPNQFKGYVIKDFFMGIGTDDPHIVYDWGLQYLSKELYPIEKYWQRSKVRRSDGGNGQTVFVKDRLVGVTKCRITIALQGLNGPGVFWQNGTLEISQATPVDPVQEFLDIPNI